MTTDATLKMLKGFRWEVLSKVFGCSHSSTIGFIAHEWIGLAKGNFVLDGAPWTHLPTTRKGRSADLLLCYADAPFAAVEVETMAKKYLEKLETILTYLQDDRFKGMQLGILVTTVVKEGAEQKLKAAISSAQSAGRDIVVIAIYRKKAPIDSLPEIRRGPYNSWEPIRIEATVCSRDGKTGRDTLWPR